MTRCPHCRASVAETDASCPVCRGALVTGQAAANPELLAGNFKLVKLLGTGGMGAVWLAEDVGLQRQVAVKLLAEKLCHDPELVERFLREARLMAKVDHPNVVPVHFVGRWDHIPFIVMKLLSGQPLAEYVRQHPLSLSEVAGVARQVCAGLSALHAQGIIHRDIKPANIFVCDGGRVLLLDLGVARESDSSLTHSGMIVGTPRYMPPEQIHGEKVDPSTDVYALAVVLYEVFAGRPMFDVSSGDSLLRAHVYAKPEPLTQVPEPVWKVIEKALEKDQPNRFTTPDAFSAALDAAIAAGGDTASATFVSPWSAPHRPVVGSGALDPTFPSGVRRGKAPIFILAGLGAVGAAASVALWLAPAELPSPAAPPPVKVAANIAPEAPVKAEVDAGAALQPSPPEQPAPAPAHAARNNPGRGTVKPPPPKEEQAPALLPR